MKRPGGQGKSSSKIFDAVGDHTEKRGACTTYLLSETRLLLTRLVRQRLKDAEDFTYLKNNMCRTCAGDGDRDEEDGGGLGVAQGKRKVQRAQKDEISFQTVRRTDRT